MLARATTRAPAAAWIRGRLRGAAFAAAAAPLGLGLAASPALAGKQPPRPRPDLVVKKGSAAPTGKAARLTVSFQLKNVGSAGAAGSTAGIMTVINGKPASITKRSTTDLAPGSARTVRLEVQVPRPLRAGTHELSVCADVDRAVKEKSEQNNCLDLGTLVDAKKIVAPSAQTPMPKPADVPKTSGPGPTQPGATPAAPIPAPGATSAPVPAATTPAATTPTAPNPAKPTPQPRPASTLPTAPIGNYPRDDVFQIGSYWAYVPSSYDGNHATPTSLLVWMHGCYGVSAGELWNATIGAGQTYIAIAPGGRDGGCWDPNSDPAGVLAAIADLETHFNIDRRRVVLGGYSSGGDMAYRMAFDDAYDFAGILVENTSPFKDTGLTQAGALGEAYWKFHVVHLAHVQDDYYAIDGVRTETDAMTTAGFPLTRIERPGTHYDNPGAVVDGQQVPGTDPDVKTYLLPHMNDGWLAPAAP